MLFVLDINERRDQRAQSLVMLIDFPARSRCQLRVNLSQFDARAFRNVLGRQKRKESLKREVKPRRRSIAANFRNDLLDGIARQRLGHALQAKLNRVR